MHFTKIKFVLYNKNDIELLNTQNCLLPTRKNLKVNVFMIVCVCVYFLQLIQWERERERDSIISLNYSRRLLTVFYESNFFSLVIYDIY